LTKATRERIPEPDTGEQCIFISSALSSLKKKLTPFPKEGRDQFVQEILRTLAQTHHREKEV